MKALLILLPLAAAKSGPVLLAEGGTNGMDAAPFQGLGRALEAAQKFSAARVVQREAALPGAGSLLNPLRADVRPDATKTTLLRVKRQDQPMTTTVTSRITEAAQATGQRALVTQTILEIVKEQPTPNAGSNNGNNNGNNNNENNNNNNNNGNNQSRGGENQNRGGENQNRGGENQNRGTENQNRGNENQNQAARETVTKTVLVNSPQETGNNNQNNNQNNGNQNNGSSQNQQASTSANNNNAEATSSRNPEAKQTGNAEKSGNRNGGKDNNNGNNQNGSQASKAGSAKTPMSTGGVIVPLSAVVPQDPAAMERIMGTNFAASGFTFRRARRVRRSVSQSWWA